MPLPTCLHYMGHFGFLKWGDSEHVCPRACGRSVAEALGQKTQPKSISLVLRMALSWVASISPIYR